MRKIAILVLMISIIGCQKKYEKVEREGSSDIALVVCRHHQRTSF